VQIQGVNSSLAFALLRQLPLLRRNPGPDPLEIHALRAQSRVINKFLTKQFGMAPGVTFTDEFTSTPLGQLRLRVYSPDRVTSKSVIYYIHGGGLILSSVETYDARCAHWAANTGSTVVSVDYRLAPEHPYPAPLDDVIAGLEWTSKNLEVFNATKIIIAGDSAGGCLAAAATLRNRDESTIDIAAQILVYPMIDDRNLGPDPRFTSPFVTWTFANNDFGWNAYLGGKAGSEDTPIYAAPARATDLRNLPRTYIDTGTKDIFLDEDIAYAQALITAGVNVEAHIWNGAPHGFDYFASKSKIAKKAWQARFDFVRRISAL
jgi:acetyl esterase/lipase